LSRVADRGLAGGDGGWVATPPPAPPHKGGGVGRQDAAPPEKLRDALAIPPYTPDWAEANGCETLAEGLRQYLVEIDVGEAAAGDIVLFRWRAHLPAKHAGILTAPDRMVHAQERAAVSEVALSEWWRRRMAYAFAYSGKDA